MIIPIINHRLGIFNEKNNEAIIIPMCDKMDIKPNILSTGELNLGICNNLPEYFFRNKLTKTRFVNPNNAVNIHAFNKSIPILFKNSIIINSLSFYFFILLFINL